MGNGGTGCRQAGDGFWDPPNSADGAGCTGAPKIPQLAGDGKDSSSSSAGWASLASGSDGQTRSSKAASGGAELLMPCWTEWASNSDRMLMGRPRNADGNSAKKW